MTTHHTCTWPAQPCAWCEDTINHLQPCGQPGCANYIDDRDPSTGDLAVTVDPDDPHYAIELWHCNRCLSQLDTLLADTGCGYCIDGWMPAFDGVLGPAYRTCRYCRAACPTCHGVGRFAASFFDHEDGELIYDNTYLIDVFTTHGLRPLFCGTCHGLVTVVPMRHPTGGDRP